MREIGALRLAMFSAWILAVCAVCFALLNQERFFAVHAKSIARLEQKSGSVMARPEGAVRWNETSDRQSFVDGDRIATGRGSKGKVSFGEARGAVDLGEDTQIQVSTIMQKGKDFAFVVTLVRGSLVVDLKNDCERCAAIIVRSGNSTFNVKAGERVGLLKPVGTSGIKRFNPQDQAPKPKPVVTVIPERFLELTPPPPPPPVPVPSAPAPLPPPPPAPPPAPVVDLAGQEVELDAISGHSWWTLEPIAAILGESISIGMKMPTFDPKGGTWKPTVEVSGARGSGSPIMISTLSPSDKSARIPLDIVRKVATESRKGAFLEYAFSLRSGIQVNVAGKVSGTLSSKRQELSIRSLSGLGSGPVSLGLDLLQKGERVALMEPKTEHAVANAPIIVRLASGQDLTKLSPFIYGASTLGVAREGLVSNEGTFMVRNQAIVAELGGSAMSAGERKNLLSTLGGQFIFRGPRSSYYDLRGQSQTALVDMIGALLDKGKVLYILKKNKIYPVNRAFIKTSNEVAKFVEGQAKAVFLEKVEILEHR